MHATVEIIARDGVGAFRVEDVGHRIGVAKTTIYRYFATRERLMLEAIRQITADHLRPLLEPTPHEPLEFRLDQFVFGLCQAARQPSVQAVFAPGPAVLAAESAIAADQVKATLSRLAERLAELAARSGVDGRLAPLAPVLVSGIFASAGWSPAACCDTMAEALAG
ncbi:MAG TPA: TetR/AcrR family transcriptional regulator [Gemmatimonadales bacterium]|nr:TetR/AcrR family transcriptional regulator [Gemmatimonadales bacterium]